MRLFLLALALLILSCSEKKDSTADFKTASIANSMESIQFRIEHLKMTAGAYYSENPEKFGPAYAVSLSLDSLLLDFNDFADSLLELNLSAIELKAVVEHYDATLEKLQKLKYKNRIDIENPEAIVIGDKTIKLDKDLILYLKQNISIEVSHALEYNNYDMGYGCGFVVPHISFNQDDSNSILFSDYLIQQVKHRQIKLTEITKDGEVQDLRPRIENLQTFGKVSFDTLTAGDYTIKGDVYLLHGFSNFMMEPFEYNFEIE